MKKYFKYFILFLTVLNSVNLHSQDQLTNLEKYWKYRLKLLDDFTIQDSDVLKLGVNIPVNAINRTGGIMLSDCQYHVNVIRAGDGNQVRGHYLSVLATELWLLKNNEQDYSETLKELYYFMLAMERLDAYSESYIRAAQDYNMFYNWNRSNWYPSIHYAEGDINGFQIRNDFDELFWIENRDSFPDYVIDMGSVMYNVPGPSCESGHEPRPLNQNSQDNIIHIMVGLSLLKSLVGVENVSGIPVTFQYPHIPNYLAGKNIRNNNIVNFGLWADDFIKRYLGYIQNDNSKFSGVSSLITQFIPGLYPGYISKWYLWDPVRDQYVFQGCGNDDGSLPIVLNKGFLDAGENITGDDLQEVYDHGLRWFYELEFSSTVLSTTVNKLTRVIGTLGDSKTNTLEIIKSQRFDQYENFEGEDKLVPLEHLPLVYIINNRNKYNREDFYTIGSPEYFNEINYYNNLLNLAEECGACSYLDSTWSTSSRLVSPEKNGDNTDKDIRYTGLDYMLLHNLRYIAFLWEEFDDVTAEPWYYNETKTLSGGDIFSQSAIIDSDIEFKASRKIVLQPGFTIDNSRFLAHISSNSNDYTPTDYVKLNVNECELPEFTGNLKSLPTEISDDFSTLNSEYNQLDTEFKLYPNPVSDELTLKIPHTEGQKSIRLVIYNSYGILLYDEYLDASESITINTNFLTSGIYILMIENQNSMYTIKFIKQ